MTDAHEPITRLWNLALADATFPAEYMELETAHPGIKAFLVHNAEVMASWWARSLRAQIREIGWCLYATGGIDAMIAATDAMRGWGAYPLDFAEFMKLVHSVWTGIGLSDDPRGIYELADRPRVWSPNLG